MLRFMLNMNRGIVASISDGMVAKHVEEARYSTMQDILTAYLANGRRFLHVRYHPELHATLKANGVMRDGELIFIEEVQLVDEVVVKINHV